MAGKAPMSPPQAKDEDYKLDGGKTQAMLPTKENESVKETLKSLNLISCARSPLWYRTTTIYQGSLWRLKTRASIFTLFRIPDHSYDEPLLLPVEGTGNPVVDEYTYAANSVVWRQDLEWEYESMAVGKNTLAVPKSKDFKLYVKAITEWAAARAGVGTRVRQYVNGLIRESESHAYYPGRPREFVLDDDLSAASRRDNYMRVLAGCVPQTVVDAVWGARLRYVTSAMQAQYYAAANAGVLKVWRTEGLGMGRWSLDALKEEGDLNTADGWANMVEGFCAHVRRLHDQCRSVRLVRLLEEQSWRSDQNDPLLTELVSAKMRLMGWRAVSSGLKPGATTTESKALSLLGTVAGSEADLVSLVTKLVLYSTCGGASPLWFGTDQISFQSTPADILTAVTLRLLFPNNSTLPMQEYLRIFYCDHWGDEAWAVSPLAQIDEDDAFALTEQSCQWGPGGPRVNSAFSTVAYSGVRDDEELWEEVWNDIYVQASAGDGRMRPNQMAVLRVASARARSSPLRYFVREMDEVMKVYGSSAFRESPQMGEFMSPGLPRDVAERFRFTTLEVTAGLLSECIPPGAEEDVPTLKAKYLDALNKQTLENQKSVSAELAYITRAVRVEKLAFELEQFINPPCPPTQKAYLTKAVERLYGKNDLLNTVEKICRMQVLQPLEGVDTIDEMMPRATREDDPYAKREAEYYMSNCGALRLYHWMWDPVNGGQVTPVDIRNMDDLRDTSMGYYFLSSPQPLQTEVEGEALNQWALSEFVRVGVDTKEARDAYNLYKGPCQITDANFTLQFAVYSAEKLTDALLPSSTITEEVAEHRDANQRYALTHLKLPILSLKVGFYAPESLLSDYYKLRSSASVCYIPPLRYFEDFFRDMDPDQIDLTDVGRPLGTLSWDVCRYDFPFSVGDMADVGGQECPGAFGFTYKETRSATIPKQESVVSDLKPSDAVNEPEQENKPDVIAHVPTPGVVDPPSENVEGEDNTGT
eukprot:TRINITY_DN46601_c0_g1_i1.p1 TRINITY_DN46601_c0_g1~~TRINITY_DN46601_c0_g1_i1.p1  ORF type:complete len:984 (+),score=41.46 TRINITY_DN46601_c0_g1_i1:106-3057(+)